MRVLITNDDGYDSIGIRALYDIFSKKHDCWLIAPTSQRSGQSHSISISEEFTIKKIDEKIFSCSGRTVDSIIAAQTLVFFPKDFDLLISGINEGANLGTEVIFSSTAAAARHASFFGLPSIAVSNEDSKASKENYEFIANYILNNIDAIKNKWQEDCFININFPKGIDIQKEYNLFWANSLGIKIFDNSKSIIKQKSPDTYSFLINGTAIENFKNDSDIDLIYKKNIVASLIKSYPEIKI